MATVKVVPRSLTDAYKRREGDFSPNLVGFQFTDGVSLFTFGNFQITSNFDRKINKNFVLGGEWSDYYSLDNLDLTLDQSLSLMSNDLLVRLNFDINKIDRYVYFGSFYEFARVTIEQIIQKWKGSLYLNPQITNTAVNTVLSFSYDSALNESSFLIPKNIISNPYALIIDDNQDFSDLLPEDIFNLSRDYREYVIWNGSNEFPVIEYTGSTTSFPYLRVKVEGNPFPSLTASTFGQLVYHVKPNNTEVELFFNQLSDFEKILLNRLTTPIYTSSFSVPQEVNGFIVFNQKRLTWPISDGYNLDNNTREYGLYVEDMLSMADLFDKYKTDLVGRKFVSESIHEYDTQGGGDETSGRKVNKLLRIYGREFDEIKKYIDGISFANVVTYNKLDNTSDELIKMIAKNLGFDTLLTVGTDNFNLLEQIQPDYQTTFSGYSRSLSSKELDVELWRRLVINAWWLFKSKGTRKVIEFFFKLFNIPQCMISLDEYVYLANDKLDIDKVYGELLKIFNEEEINLSDYPMDVYGFPKVLPETNDNYFQMNGFWYNGGSDSIVGNNPHIGDYDYGKSYFSQFECFVDNFESLLTGATTVTVNENSFNNYNKGTFIFDQNGLPVPYYGTGYENTLNNGLVQNAVVNDAGLVSVGGSNSPKFGVPSGDTYSMKISFTAGEKKVCDPCAYEFTYGDDGIVYISGDVLKPLNDQKCCQNYWLPSSTSNPTTVCPSSIDIYMTADDNPLGPCIIFDSKTNKSVSQSCCNKTTLGFDVTWDGTNCVDTQCITSLGGNGGGGFGDPTGAVNSNIVEVINDTSNPYICYWCPPDSQIKIVCSVEEYLEPLTMTAIEELALSLGWDNTGPFSLSPTVFLGGIFSVFFSTYGCLILDNNYNQIKNQSCCTLKGGEWTLVEGQYYCVKPLDNPCSDSSINESHVLIDNGGNLLSEACCNTLGYTWTDGTITVTNQPSIQDSIGVSFANGLGSSSYCTACPTILTYVEECDALGSCFQVVKDNSNANLSEKCCTDYGFSWDVENGRCLLCQPVVNYINEYPYLITNLDDTDLTQACCESNNGWFGYAQIVTQSGPGTAKCYQCPPLYYYNSANDSTPIQNTNYTIFEGEIVYNGESLIQVCCDNYNQFVGTASWDVVTQKCYIS